MLLMQKKLSVYLTISLLIIIILAVLIWLVSGSSCKALNNCDPYGPVCASSGLEHQFFYSQCDMVRENCMTGSGWKHDHFSHCNV